MYKTSAVKKPVWLGQSSATPARFATSHAILNQLTVRWIYERAYDGSAGASTVTTIGVRDEDPSASTLAYTAEGVSTHRNSLSHHDVFARLKRDEFAAVERDKQRGCTSFIDQHPIHNGVKHLNFGSNSDPRLINERPTGGRNRSSRQHHHS